MTEAHAPVASAEEFWTSMHEKGAALGYWSQPYLVDMVSSKTDGKWFLEYVRDKYFAGKPARSALSLGCGNGEIDRIAYGKQIFSAVHGLDFSSGGIEIARAEAVKAGMPGRYSRVDLNTEPVPGNERYDLVYDYASSHHIANLDNVMSSVEAHLEPNGYFVLYGYCGPARMQWSPRVLELSNALMRRLPMRLRASLPEVRRPTAWEFKSDPSEAVRGRDVVDFVRAYFDVVEEIDIGLSLSHGMFAHNAHHLNPHNESEQAIFRLVCQYEDLLVSEGIIESDTKVMVCKRRAVDPLRPGG